MVRRPKSVHGTDLLLFPFTEEEQYPGCAALKEVCSCMI